MKIPNPQTLDRPQKLVNFLNLLVFLAVFLGLYLTARHFIHSILLRILCLLAAYFVSAMLTYCVIRPLSEKTLSSLRKKK